MEPQGGRKKTLAVKSERHPTPLPRRPLCVHFPSRWPVPIWVDVLLLRVWLALAPVASYFHLSAKKKKCSEMPGNIKIDAETIKCFSWASETVFLLKDMNSHMLSRLGAQTA